MTPESWAEAEVVLRDHLILTCRGCGAGGHLIVMEPRDLPDPDGNLPTDDDPDEASGE